MQTYHRSQIFQLGILLASKFIEQYYHFKSQSSAYFVNVREHEIEKCCNRQYNWKRKFSNLVVFLSFSCGSDLFLPN